MKKVAGLLLFLSAIAPGLARAEGGGVSNGGDHLDQNDKVAWFNAEGRTIRYCYVMSDEFGALLAPESQADETVDDLISDSFNAWTNYRYYHTHFALGSGQSSPLEAMGACDGSEDIKIYLGVEDDRVRAARAQFKEPFGFATRVSYDPAQKWGKGFIWIAQEGAYGTLPEWSRNRDYLRGILLHEWGHVFGCEHVEGTIMDPQPLDLLMRYLQPGTFYTLGIDLERELLPCFDCDLDSISQLSAANFTRFTGQPPVGRQDAVFSLRPGSEGLWASLTLLQNPTRNWSFHFQELSLISEWTDEATVFSNLHTQGRTYWGKMEPNPTFPHGARVIVNRNLGSTLDVRLLDEVTGQVTSLFDSKAQF